MRITILQGAFLPVPPLHGGAVEKLWFELGKRFASLGHHVVHLSRTHHDLPVQQDIGGVKHIRIRGYKMPANGLLLKLLDLIYSLRALGSLPSADILITNTFWMPILCRFSSRRTGQIIVSVERMPKGQMWLYSHVSVLRCCSSAVQERVLCEQPRLASKTVVIPNPLPFDVSSAVLLPDKSPTILYCGRIHPEKGLDLLIRSFASACNIGLNGWTLRIIGPSDVAHGGGGRAFLRNLQHLSLNFGAPIEWLGPIYDDHRLLQEYNKASLFVYPSLAHQGEAMPLAPLEAMAHGVIPIVSALPCFDEYIRDRVNGLVFNHRAADSVTRLARMFVELASDPDLRSRLSIQASSVRETYAPSAIADQFNLLFSQLLLPRL